MNCLTRCYSNFTTARLKQHRAILCTLQTEDKYNSAPVNPTFVEQLDAIDTVLDERVQDELPRATG